MVTNIGVENVTIIIK